MKTRYVRGDVVDQLFARLGTDDATFWYLTDRQGNIRDIVDEDGVVADHLDYSGFGEIINETAPAYRGRFAYTSREYDAEINLQYNRARYYDATIGRWISQDPLGFDAGDSNLYRYVHNAYPNSSDPSGLWTRDGLLNEFFRIYKDQGRQLYDQMRRMGVEFDSDGNRNFAHDWYYYPDRRVIEIAATSGMLFWSREVTDTEAAHELHEALEWLTTRQPPPPPPAPVNPIGRDIFVGLVSFLPVIGDIMDWTELTTGVDLATGEKLSTGDRFVTGMAAFIPIVPASWLRKVARGIGNIFGSGAHLGDNLVGVGRAIDHVDGVPLPPGAHRHLDPLPVGPGAPVHAPGAITGTRARKLLADSLGPSDLPVRAQAQAHHIFGVSQFDTPLGRRLQSWGIDLNSAQNGIWLPSRHYPGRLATLHNGASSQEYIGYVNSRLNAARNRANALEILDEIKEELRFNRLRINNAK